MDKPKWEIISHTEKWDTVSDRLWIPSGWIVRSKYIHFYEGGTAVHQVLVDDMNHKWELEDSNG